MADRSEQPVDIHYEEFTRIVVAIDPAVTSSEEADDTGIMVVARGPHQPSTCEIPSCPGHGYVLEDLSCHLPPAGWARVAVDGYNKWKADRIIAETNNGGDMVETVVHAIQVGVSYSKVTATRGKQLRAEPISALYEQGRVHHLGSFPELREQQETWTPEAGWSPDRLDALVWGLTYLGLTGGQGAAFMRAMQDEISNRKPGPPPELKGMPHHINDIDHPIAPARCKGGGPHRFQREANGALCAVCGGWKDVQ